MGSVWVGMVRERKFVLTDRFWQSCRVTLAIELWETGEREPIDVWLIDTYQRREVGVEVGGEKGKKEEKKKEI